MGRRLAASIPVYLAGTRGAGPPTGEGQEHFRINGAGYSTSHPFNPQQLPNTQRATRGRVRSAQGQEASAVNASQKGRFQDQVDIPPHS